jgi:hypothetical protein
MSRPITDRTLPAWLRPVLLFTGLLQAVLGIALLLNPAAINGLWPWPLSPITARLLGASSLVSMPLSFLSAIANRQSAARIPLVMVISYRVLQVLAGLIHIDRFDFRRPLTWNYFGGGVLFLLLLAVALAFGSRLGKPVADEPAWLGGDRALVLGRVGKLVLRLLAAIYFIWGLTFLILGSAAAGMWFEAPGLATSLTLRLFASPIMGLALGMWLISRAGHWRQVLIPAVALVVIGLTGSFAIGVEWSSVRPPTPLGYVTAVTPLILLLVGLYLLLATRRRA